MRYYRMIIMLLVFVLAYGITGLAAVTECTECTHAHDGGSSTLADEDCDEEEEIGQTAYTSAIHGECDEENTSKDCEEGTATKPVEVDEWECQSIEPIIWQQVEQDAKTVNVADCTDEDRS